MSIWLTALEVQTELMPAPARLPTGDWTQDTPERLPVPLWVESVAELAQRLSIENSRGLYALQLFDTFSYGDSGGLLHLARWANEARYHVGGVEAVQPIAEGFLRRLRFWRSKDAPQHARTVAEVVQLFCSVEARRDEGLEPWLRTQIGEKRPPEELYQWIDYPGFDSGSMGVGFAVFVHGPELHVWSRAVHAHK